ncbi:MULTISPECIES: TonB-dependent receptor [unclassified Cellvibrio]|uniref:TonB-dependent receptor n=1 Tax=unclassified Cellvibrio TaxID=2624793 RepID=UPI001245DB19|nr:MULTISPECIES: TonB-dependent receptor [unclassified Cellvibrio]QEY10911.1 TonB-dependent receptor [Cellvibrio sp. KY-YJ-3]UUA70959.1 TonB-dependent receptor [Cellvibrio sp. QJXJ]
MKKQTFNHVLAMAATMALVSGSQVVYAQQGANSQSNATEKDIEEVVVTGFRQSVLNALDAKRSSDTVIEAISADDIGGLPDVSIADSLSRLPGVTSVRTGGQASELNIRGMSGDFVFATMNGREQVSTSTGPIAGRKIEFDVYPSELISQAAVYKSPKASLIEGGVAGSIELTTVNPLKNSKEHSFNVGVRGSSNSRTSEVEDAIDFGHRFNASYQGKFADETIGFALGYAKLSAPSVANQYIGLNYNGQRNIDADADNEFVSEGMEMQQRGGEEQRDSYLATVVWEPNESFTLKGDVFNTKADSEAFARGFRVKTLHSENTVITNPVIVDNNMIGGTVSGDGTSNFAVFTVNDNDSREAEVLSYGLNAEWRLNQWTINADVSFSESDGDFQNGGTRALLYNDTSVANPVRSAESITYINKGLKPADFFASQDYTNLNRIALTEVGQWPFITHNEINAQKIDVKYEMDTPFITSVEAGIRNSSREYTGARGQDGYGSEFGNHPSQFPIALTDDMVKVVEFGGDLKGMPNFFAIDFDDAVAAVEAARGRDWNPVANWENNWTMIQSGTVTEDVLAAYVMANFATELGATPVTGNLGVRVVESDQSSDGYLQIGAGAGQPITDERGVVSNDYVTNTMGQKYTDYLPSLNLNFQITDQDNIRFAAAKVMSRPPVSQLKSGAGSWIDGEDRFNAWGNTSPLLDPFYANQYDLSYEHYFSETEGAIVVALFRKDIESFIEQITLRGVDFEALGFNVPDINPNTGNPLQPGGEYQTAYNNTKGGYIQGIELGYTQTFDFLPGLWSGLGLSSSYSYTESDVERINNLGGEEKDIGMPGLSPSNLSTTLFYDYEGFSTRLNYRYREAFVANQVAVETQEVFYADESVVDYQASYEFESGLELVFQVNNLTDEPSKTYFGSEAQTGSIQYFGRQYFFGVNYKM